MSDYFFLSTPSVALILVGVALLAMLVTLTMGALGRSGRGSTVALFVSLAVIWVGAVLVVMLIKLYMSRDSYTNFGEGLFHALG